MLKNFKYKLLSLFFFGAMFLNQAQEQRKFKAVILDGKPAKLNLNTGEVTFMKLQKPEDGNVTENLNIQPDTIKVSTKRYHTVKDGENLLDISKAYNIPLNKLKQFNDLETTLVNTGQVLLVFQPEVKENNETVKEKVSTKSNSVVTNNVHIVKKEETLYSISKTYGLSVDELKSKNNLNSNLIKIGQELNVSQRSIDNEPSSYSVIIKKGDTLFSLAKRFNTTVKELKRLNGLQSNLIIVGQTLQLK